MGAFPGGVGVLVVGMGVFPSGIGVIVVGMRVFPSGVFLFMSYQFFWDPF
jgi:hypothetical protein